MLSSVNCTEKTKKEAGIGTFVKKRLTIWVLLDISHSISHVECLKSINNFSLQGFLDDLSNEYRIG